jgi:hypothetical protein
MTANAWFARLLLTGGCQFREAEAAIPPVTSRTFY